MEETVVQKPLDLTQHRHQPRQTRALRRWGSLNCRWQPMWTGCKAMLCSVLVINRPCEEPPWKNQIPRKKRGTLDVKTALGSWELSLPVVSLMELWSYPLDHPLVVSTPFLSLGRSCALLPTDKTL